MPDFEPSPRPSKRQRTGTYRGNRTTLDSAKKASSLSSISGRLSSFSQRLWGSGGAAKEVDEDHDSAYASKEDSLNEDQVTTARESTETQQVEQLRDDEDVGETELRKSRRKPVPRKSRDPADADTPARKHGRKRDKATADINQDQENEAENERSSIVVAKRSTRLASTAKPETELDAQNIDQEEQNPKPPRRRKQRPSYGHDVAEAAGSQGIDNLEDDTDSHDAQSGRPVRRGVVQSTVLQATNASRSSPIKAKAATLESLVISPQPKGILTPSGRQRQDPRKSVVFEDSEKQIEEQLGFRDIATSTRKTASSNTVDGRGRSHQQDDDERIRLEIHDLAVETPAENIFGASGESENVSPSFPQIEDTPSITAIKHHILSHLTNRLPSTTIPPHLETQFSTLHSLLTATITSSESNSLLLLGSRGSGKSHLINTALTDLSSKHTSDFHVVKLNGFFQTDDKLALREIWRQLGREMAVDESETGEVMGSYADTMASLLSLLSHPDEIDPEAMIVDGPVVEGQGRISKSVIIILDEFDLFTTHPRQTLLYNLFDIAQSRKAPIAVIGCSTRMEVVDCLEKRVKSRFSHRWVHVPSVKSLAGFQAAVETVLCVADKEVVDGMEETDRQRWNELIKSSLLPSEDIQRLLASTFHTTKSIPDVLAALYIPIATADLSNDPLPTTSKSPAPKPKVKGKSKTKSPASSSNTITASPHPPITHHLSTNPPTLISLLPDLPTLHLTLLISATRLETLYLAPTLNFNAVYAHYTLLHQHTRLRSSSSDNGAASSLRVWGKETCKGAWEDLVQWGLFVPVARDKENGLASCGAGEGSKWHRVEVTLEEVAWAVKESVLVGGGGMKEVLGRWCRDEIVGW